MNIILIIDLYVDPNYHTNVSYLMLVNYYVAVISVVFSTGMSSALIQSASRMNLRSVWSATYSHRGGSP